MRILPDPYVLAFLLAAGVAVLLCFNRLLTALQGFVACLHGLNGTHEMLGNAYVCDSVRMLFLLLLPFLALVLVVTGISAFGYFWTLAALFGLWLFRKLVYLTVGWLTSRPHAVRSVERTGYAFAVPMILLASLAAVLVWLVPDTPRWLSWGWVGLVAVVAYVLYVRRSFSLILTAGFSPFFWVLYLCGLEILPFCVVVNILMHGN